MFELTHDDPIFTLTMNAGENRFTVDFLRAMHAQLDTVLERAGDGPAALVITGAGKYWSNGIDLESLATASPEDQGAFLPELNRLLGRLVSFPLPTVAAINGHVFAGGALLALACDHRIMRTERGWFCLPEVDIQVPFVGGMYDLLRCKLSSPTLREAVLSGRRYTGDEALAAGIVDALCDISELPTTCATTVTPLAQKGRNIFKQLKAGLYGDVAEALGHTPEG